MPLNDIKIRNLKKRDKAFKVSDFEGLYILVKVSGAKSWRSKYRIDGKERLLVIGNYPAVTLAKARQARDIAKVQLTECIDPTKQNNKKIFTSRTRMTDIFKKWSGIPCETEKEGRSAAFLSKAENRLKLANCDFGRVRASWPIRHMHAATQPNRATNHRDVEIDLDERPDPKDRK